MAKTQRGGLSDLAKQIQLRDSSTKALLSVVLMTGCGACEMLDTLDRDTEEKSGVLGYLSGPPPEDHRRYFFRFSKQSGAPGTEGRLHKVFSPFRSLPTEIFPRLLRAVHEVRKSVTDHCHGVTVKEMISRESSTFKMMIKAGMNESAEYIPELPTPIQDESETLGDSFAREKLQSIDKKPGSTQVDNFKLEGPAHAEKPKRPAVTEKTLKIISAIESATDGKDARRAGRNRMHEIFTAALNDKPDPRLFNLIVNTGLLESTGRPLGADSPLSLRLVAMGGDWSHPHWKRRGSQKRRCLGSGYSIGFGSSYSSSAQ